MSREHSGDLQSVHGSFGFPVFVKPRGLGSSVGAGKACSLQELQERSEDAFQYDSSAVVERYVKGRDITVGIVDGKAIGAIEIEPRGQFYDYKSKYKSGQSEYHMPPRLSPSRYKNVLTIAERAHECVGAKGATRVDLLVTEGENEYVLEVNTQPGLRETSLLPMIAKGAGYEYGTLCETILKGAIDGAAASSSVAHNDGERFEQSTGDSSEAQHAL